MLFNSLAYLLFLPTAWLVFWSVPRAQRLHVLLVASYVFYASWSVPYAAMIFGLVVANYVFGRALGVATSHRRALLALFVGVDLAVLGLFKYYDFFAGSIAGLLNAAGVDAHPRLLLLVLPLGISFFTFEFVHYLVDIYRGEVPVHSFARFHVFAAFFPTQIAGPIKRFQQFVPSLAAAQQGFDASLAREGLGLIGRGLAKKVLLGDRLAPWVTDGIQAASDGAIGTGDAWITLLAFSLEVYFDFSGYTDIARGSAALFGFRIPINFDMPFLATSLSDFWRRWHISLSSWLRDYIFIPLGGSRRPLVIVMTNLFITFVAAGLWHGAAWHYVVFGAMWGIGLALQQALRRVAPLPSGRVLSVAGWAFTMTFFVVSMALFRAPDLHASLVLLAAMAGRGAGAGTLSMRADLFVLATFTALLVAWLWSRHGWSIRIPAPRLGPVAAGAAACLVIVVASVAAPAASEAFIYFQF